MEIPSLKQCSNLFNGIMNSKWCHYNGKLTAECQYGEMKYIEKCRTTKYRRAIPIICLYTAYKKMKESVAICHRGETFFKIWALPANNKRTVTEIVKRLWKTHLSPILTTILVPYDEIYYTVWLKKHLSCYAPKLIQHYRKYTPATQSKTCFWLVSEKSFAMHHFLTPTKNIL